MLLDIFVGLTNDIYYIVCYTVTKEMASRCIRNFFVLQQADSYVTPLPLVPKKFYLAVKGQ